MFGTEVEKPVSVFLFPLAGVVFFPHTLKPLNIFEPRYVRMIDDAAERGARIALAFSEPMRGMRADRGAWAYVRRVAGVGEMQILERKPDGTLMVVLVGIGKVRLDEVGRETEPYLMAEGSWIEETEQLQAENIFLLHRMMKEFERWLEHNVHEREQRKAFLERLSDPVEKVNYMCALLVTSSEVQQRLLECDDVNERLKTLSVLLEEGELGVPYQ